jgi:hypothetical protein
VGEEGQIWSMYFIYLYENRTMNLRKNDSGDESNQDACKHIWKYHNKTPLYN